MVDEATRRVRPELLVVVGILALVAGLAGTVLWWRHDTALALTPLGVVCGFVYTAGLLHWVWWCRHLQDRLDGPAELWVVPPSSAAIVALATALSLVDAIGDPRGMSWLDVLCSVAFLLACGYVTLLLAWAAAPGPARGRGWHLPSAVGMLAAVDLAWAPVATLDRRWAEGGVLLVTGLGAALIAAGLSVMVVPPEVDPAIRAAYRPSVNAAEDDD